MKRSYSDKQISEVIALAQSGLKAEAISRLTGITSSTFKPWCMKRGITFGAPKQWALKDRKTKNPTPPPHATGYRWFGTKWH
jgi:DNA invertase Pin-like site-specific DNA recombinase